MKLKSLIENPVTHYRIDKIHFVSLLEKLKQRYQGEIRKTIIEAQVAALLAKDILFESDISNRIKDILNGTNSKDDDVLKIMAYVKNALNYEDNKIKLFNVEYATDKLHTEMELLFSKADRVYRNIEKNRIEIGSLATEMEEAAEAVTLCGKKVSEIESRCEDSYDRLTKKLANRLDDYLEEKSDQYYESLDITTSEMVDNFKGKEKLLLDKLSKINKLCSATAGNAEVHKFSKSASDEARLGWYFRILAMSSCVALILFVLISVWEFDDRFNLLGGGFSHYWFFAMFLIPFVYCAKESATHYNNARRYRRKELDLAAISPYLSDLPDEDARELKKKLAETFFSNEDKLEKKDVDERSISLGFGSVKELLDYSLKIFKAGK